MAILATNRLKGAYGVPGAGLFQGGETKEVSLAVASYLLDKPAFALEFTDLRELAHRGEDGRVRYIGFNGAVDSRVGYGGAGIIILRALTQLGIQARVNRGWTPYAIDLHPDAAAQLTKRDFIPRLELSHCFPEAFRLSQAALCVGYTMWETTRIPQGDVDGFEDWAALSNEMDALLVPCQFSKDVFEACGVTRPITVLPYGIDTDEWPLLERPERETFTVVQFGDLSSRKGPFEAVEAFQRAFPRELNARLVLKTIGGKFGPGRYGIPQFRDPRIQVIDAAWTRRQLLQFLADADCFIWLSRGEGFGLPPLQAALTGLPVVMTTHTGMAEYYNPLYFYGVKTACTSPAPMGGEWFDPDVESAAEQLRKVYDDRKAATKRAKSASTYIRKKFSLAAFADRLGNYLEQF